MSFTDTNSNSEDSLQHVPTEVLHLILTHLLHSAYEQFEISSEQKEEFIRVLRKGFMVSYFSIPRTLVLVHICIWCLGFLEFPIHRVPVILLPFVYLDKQDTPMEKIVQDSPNVANNMVRL